MRKHYIYTIIFLIIFILLICAVDYFLTNRYRNFNYNEYYTLNSIARGKLSTNIAIFGTSRAQSHFYPKTMQSEEKTVYNFGLEGTGLEEQLLLLDFYLSLNHAPSILVISLDPYSFDERWLSNRPFHEERYFPYIKNAVVFQHLKEKYGVRAYAWRYIPLFRYIDMRRFKPINIFNKENQFEDGSFLIDKEWDGTFEKFVQQNPEGITYQIQPRLVEALKNIIQMAQSENAEVILVLTPTLAEEHRLEKNRNEVLQIFQNITKEFNIPFLDYSLHPLSTNRNNFYNSQHLKKSAAIEFSDIFIRDLLKL